MRAKLLFAMAVGLASCGQTDTIIVDVSGGADTLVVAGRVDTAVVTLADTSFGPTDTVIVTRLDTVYSPVDTVVVTTIDTVISGTDTTIVTTTDTVFTIDTVLVTTVDTVVTVDTVIVVDTINVTTTLVASVSNLNIRVGQTASLSVTAQNPLGFPTIPSGVTWLSEAPGVATVSSTGVVRGIAAGQTRIFALSAGLSATVPTTVTDTTSVSPPAPPNPSYPNQPNGMVQVFRADGTQSLFPELVEFSPWQSNVRVVDDPTNPAGTGKVLEFVTPVGQNEPGGAAALTLAGGPWREWYVMYRIYYDPNYEVHGHKLWFGGVVSSSRSQGFDNPTQWYLTREADGSTKITQQNNGSVNLVYSQPGIFTLGVWHSIELHLVSESSPGAGDGRVRYWFDGQELTNGSVRSPNNAVSWVRPTHPQVGFDGFYWFAQSNNTNSRRDYFRVGEFYISGKNNVPNPGG